MGLLVGDVIRHAARVVPGRLAATMGATELSFGRVHPDRQLPDDERSHGYANCGNQRLVAVSSSSVMARSAS